MTNKIPHDAPLSAYVLSDPELNRVFGSRLAKMKPEKPTADYIGSVLPELPKDEALILDRHYRLLQPTFVEKIIAIFQEFVGFLKSLFSTDRPHETPSRSSISDDDAAILDECYQPMFGQLVTEAP